MLLISTFLKDLAKKDLLSQSDGYVKVFLLPGKHIELKTKVIKKSSNPDFNDSYSFFVNISEARRKTLAMQVFDKETYMKDDPIGEVQIPLWTDLLQETFARAELGKITRGKDGMAVLTN